MIRTSRCEGLASEDALFERCRTAVVAPLEGYQHNDRLVLAMQVQIPVYLPISLPGSGYGSGAARNLWKMRDIENRSPYHRMLNLGKVVCRDVRVQHTSSLVARLVAASAGPLELILRRQGSSSEQ